MILACPNPCSLVADAGMYIINNTDMTKTTMYAVSIIARCTYPALYCIASHIIHVADTQLWHRLLVTYDANTCPALYARILVSIGYAMLCTAHAPMTVCSKTLTCYDGVAIHVAVLVPWAHSACMTSIRVHEEHTPTNHTGIIIHS